MSLPRFEPYAWAAERAPRANVVALVALFVGACGGDKQPADTAPGDTSVEVQDVADATPDVDPTLTACCPVGACADSTKACIGGACVPKKASADACYFDGECRDGKRCLAATFCACGASECTAVAGTCGFGEGCCGADAECGAGLACVAGTCKAKPATGCLSDAHCAAGQVCEGAAPVACGATGSDVVGYCATAGVCCIDDRECGDGVCRGGSCVKRASAGTCWADAECGNGEACLGAHLCQCVPGSTACGAVGNVDLPSTPGRCGRAEDSCCSKDSECTGDQICVQGACAAKPNQALDQCWVDAHCGVGRACEGASLCGCNEDGCTESTIGQCKTLAIACTANADCPAAMHCSSPDTAVCPGSDAPIQKVCVANVDNACWDKGDCPKVDERCGNETVCRDPGGCDWPNTPGQCLGKIRRWDCCDAHGECADGYTCRNQDTSVTCPPAPSAICLDDAIFGDTCWNVNDCPAGLSCSRVWVCGCEGKCNYNRAGGCDIPTNCQTDFDCGPGYTCAVDPECFSSPCTSSTTCVSGGRCQEKVDGGCWSHSECGAGRYCEGLRVCPADLQCALPDQPGVCGPRAALGECCSSFKGCEPGLRCSSPAARSGCTIDRTSVCVPAVTPGTSCYADDDCDAQQRCDGARICPCGVDTCTTPPQAGSCVAR